MKKIFILLVLPYLLFAETYVLGGGKHSVVHTVAAKILEKAYVHAGLEIKPTFVDLQRSLELSNSGQIDGELGRIRKISQTYKNLKIIPVSIIDVEAIAFSKLKDLRVKKWDDLSQYTLTVVSGTKFIETATKDHHNRMVVSTFEEAFSRLVNDETQVVVIQKLAGIKMLHERKFKGVEIVSPSLQNLKLYHFVHKKNEHLIPILTPILEKMKRSGEIDYIKQAYLQSITQD